MTALEFEIDTEELLGTTRGFAAKASETATLHERLARRVIEAVDENFVREGRPDKWPPLKPATVRERKRKGFWPGRILERTGALRRSITTATGADGVKVATFLPYARIQHAGGRTGRRHRTVLPARPFMHLTAEDVEEIVELVKRWLEEGDGRT